MVSLQQFEDQYRAIIAQMDLSEAAMARHDLDAVEACAHGVEQTLAELAQASAQFEGLVIVPGEESAWNGLAGAMRQALVRAEHNRATVQRWIGQTEDILSQMSRGGRAVNGYSTTGMPDGAEFLSARG